MPADPLGVLEDLGDEGVLLLRHVAELLEQRQVAVRLDVALRAGVAVPVPGAAEVAAGLDDAEVGDALLGQPAAASRPLNPPPMMATSTSSVIGSRREARLDVRVVLGVAGERRRPSRCTGRRRRRAAACRARAGSSRAARRGRSRDHRADHPSRRPYKGRTLRSEVGADRAEPSQDGPAVSTDRWTSRSPGPSTVRSMSARAVGPASSRGARERPGHLETRSTSIMRKRLALITLAAAAGLAGVAASAGSANAAPPAPSPVTGSREGLRDVVHQPVRHVGRRPPPQAGHDGRRLLLPQQPAARRPGRLVRDQPRRARRRTSTAARCPCRRTLPHC